MSWNLSLAVIRRREDFALVFVSNEDTPQDMTCTYDACLKALGVDKSAAYTIRDLWLHKDVGAWWHPPCAAASLPPGPPTMHAAAAAAVIVFRGKPLRVLICCVHDTRARVCMCVCVLRPRHSLVCRWVLIRRQAASDPRRRRSLPLHQALMNCTAGSRNAHEWRVSTRQWRSTQALNIPHDHYTVHVSSLVAM